MKDIGPSFCKATTQGIVLVVAFQDEIAVRLLKQKFEDFHRFSPRASLVWAMVPERESRVVEFSLLK